MRAFQQENSFQLFRNGNKRQNIILYTQLSHFNFKRETLLIRKTNMLNFGAQFSESKMMIITQNLLLRFSWSYFGK